MILNEFGERIKYLREIKGLSQKDLSSMTGLVREQISRIENGLINPTLLTIVRLSEALNITVKELFNYRIANYDNKHKSILKPFVKWAGGKTQVLSRIKDYMPTSFNQYFEPFIGGGALFFDITPTKATINDSNTELMITYKCFQDSNDYMMMIDEIKKHEQNHSEDYYYLVRDMDREENYTTLPNHIKAARLIYLNKACFNGLYRVNAKGYFNVPSGKKEKVKAYDKELFDNLHEFLSNKSIRIMNTDFKEAVKNANEGDFVYFDPPYDTLDEKDSFTSYTKDCFGKEEQIKLANVFKELSENKVKVMLSNHNTAFIRDLYKDFNIHVIEAKRMINSNANGRGNVEEVIITNY